MAPLSIKIYHLLACPKLSSVVNCWSLHSILQGGKTPTLPPACSRDLISKWGYIISPEPWSWSAELLWHVYFIIYSIHLWVGLAPCSFFKGTQRDRLLTSQFRFSPISRRTATNCLLAIIMGLTTGSLGISSRNIQKKSVPIKYAADGWHLQQQQQHLKVAHFEIHFNLLGFSLPSTSQTYQNQQMLLDSRRLLTGMRMHVPF